MVNRGLSDPGQNMIWSKLNSYELDVPNDVAAFLLSNDGDFQSDDGLDFGEVINDAFGGRLLGVAELQQAFANATSTATTVPGFQIEVEAIGKPIKVDFSGLINNTATSQGTAVTLLEDGTAIGLAFPIAAVVGQSMYLNMSATRIPQSGLHVYSVQIARYTSGTSSLLGGATLPATLTATEL